MKISALITSIALTFCLTDCHSETGMDRKIDSSSELTYKQSMNKITAELSPTDLQKFNQAYDVITKRIGFAIASANFFTQDKKEKMDAVKAAGKAFYAQINGKTPKDIIQIAASPNGVSELISNATTNAKTDKDSLVKQPITAHLNVPFNIDGIEIMISGIHIGNLQQKKGIDISFLGPTDSVPLDPFILASVAIKNITEGNIIHLQYAWADCGIRDNFDNLYSAPENYRFFTSNIKDEVAIHVLKPGEAVNDLMVFDIPLNNAQKFTLTCDPNFFHRVGNQYPISTNSFNLDFTRSDIK
jgi:hypothetical protein